MTTRSFDPFLFFFFFHSLFLFCFFSSSPVHHIAQVSWSATTHFHSQASSEASSKMKVKSLLLLSLLFNIEVLATGSSKGKSRLNTHPHLHGISIHQPPILNEIKHHKIEPRDLDVVNGNVINLPSSSATPSNKIYDMTTNPTNHSLVYEAVPLLVSGMVSVNQRIRIASRRVTTS